MFIGQDAMRTTLMNVIYLPFFFVFFGFFGEFRCHPEWIEFPITISVSAKFTISTNLPANAMMQKSDGKNVTVFVVGHNDR